MTSMHRTLQTAVAGYFIVCTIYKGVYKGGGGEGSGGSTPPPQKKKKIQIFFLKIEGQNIEKKMEKI